MALFNSKSKQLEADIESYLDRIATSSMIFHEGIKAYISDNKDRFEKHYIDIKKVESEADSIRRDIKHKLYTYMLIPESRGDVLGLLETMDDIADTCEDVLEQFSIEKPYIFDFLKEGFLELADKSAMAAEEVVKATRAFFKEITMVNNFLNKVYFYEREVDEIEERVKRKAFDSEEIKRFSKKVHIRYFAERIALVSDVSQSVAERLSVYAIKRRI